MIYLLEDETSIRKLVTYTLENSGFEIRGFSSAKDFWLAIDEMIPKLILLDIMLPDGDGIEILKKLRQGYKTADLPIMMLTAKGTEFDKVFGLDAGADDYLPKPFGMMELVARVKSLLRRSNINNHEHEEYRLGELVVNIPKHKVLVNGKEIELTIKEFNVLVYLLKNQGIVLSRDQVMTGIWGYDYDGESRTVDVHIRTLRSKLGSCADLIETVRGFGYRIGNKV